MLGSDYNLRMVSVILNSIFYKIKDPKPLGTPDLN